MRLLALIAALALAVPAAAQDEVRPKAKKKAAAKKDAVATQQGARKKPTPEQIRRFKELEKKKQRS